MTTMCKQSARALFAFGSIVLISSCSRSVADAAEPEASTQVHATSPARAELLDRAFRTASALPLDPHIKTRSRAQQNVVLACVELGELDRAESFTAQIADWRRALCYAELAAVDGASPERANRWLSRAEQDVARLVEQPTGQAWRHDRVLAKLAIARDVLGLADEPAPRAETTPPADIQRSLDQADQVVASGDLDRVQELLTDCVAWFRRSDLDEELRSRCAGVVRVGSATLPSQLRIELEIELFRAAIDRSDRARATQILAEIREVFAAANWLPEARVPIAARIALLHDALGDRDTARRELDRVAEDYREHETKIVDIYRLGALLPLAEGYLGIGDVDTARSVYAQALAAALLNPNSRPRAVDLSAACVSMARHGLEPDASLHEALDRAEQQLGAPW